MARDLAFTCGKVRLRVGVVVLRRFLGVPVLVIDDDGEERYCFPIAVVGDVPPTFSIVYTTTLCNVRYEVVIVHN